MVMITSRILCNFFDDAFLVKETIQIAVLSTTLPPLHPPGLALPPARAVVSEEDRQNPSTVSY